MARRALFAYPNSGDKGNINNDDDDVEDDLKEEPNLKQMVESKESIESKYLMLSVAMILIVLFCYTFSFDYIKRHFNRDIQKDNINVILSNHISLKKDQFPSQYSGIWGDIFAGLIRLNDDPVKPAVYLLTFEKDALMSSSCIVEIITTSANKYLLNNDRWLLLNGSSISEHKDQDPGVLIDTLSQQMEFSKVIIVTDVQKIPAKLAQGFHFLVDEYNPKFGDAVYIFTLLIPEQKSNLSAVEIAEDILSACWGELDNDVRQALITRVTNVVLPISKEDMNESCPLKISSTIEVNLPKV